METQKKTSNFYQAYRKSWLAYLRPFITLAILCTIAYGGFLLPWKNPFWLKYRLWIVGGLVAFGLFWCVFRLLDIRSLVLYTNEDGVWVYSGILPWTEGVSGVKWQDLDDAKFYPGFFNWLFQTYKVRIGHRFTKESEIVLSMIWKGQKAATHINEKMYQYNRDRKS